DRETWTIQSEQVRDPAGGKTRSVAGPEISVDTLRLLDDTVQLSVVVAANADEHTGLAAAEFVGGLPRIFERFPTHFQQHALLGIQTVRLTRRDTKKRRVKLVDIVDEPTPARVHLARCSRRRIVVAIDLPAIAGNLVDRINTVPERLPKLVRRIDVAGKATP